jgi:hypothetical protein
MHMRSGHVGAKLSTTTEGWADLISNNHTGHSGIEAPDMIGHSIVTFSSESLRHDPS